MHEKDDLDLLLDNVLSNYGDPGPDSGLERRVLAGVRTRMAAESAPRRRWLPWAVALPTAACLLLIFLAAPRTVHAPAGHATSSASPQEVPLTTTHTGSRPVLIPAPAPRNRQLPTGLQFHRGDRASKPVALPKLDVFPTPQPLTPAELALVTFAAHASEDERKSFIAAQKQADAPLRIAAIEIPPIESPAKGTN